LDCLLVLLRSYLPLPSPWFVVTSAGRRPGEPSLPRWYMAAEPPWSSSEHTQRREMPSMSSPDAGVEAAVFGNAWWCGLLEQKFRENSSTFLVTAFVSSSWIFCCCF
jgi:hypothetical protein